MRLTPLNIYANANLLYALAPFGAKLVLIRLISRLSHQYVIIIYGDIR